MAGLWMDGFDYGASTADITTRYGGLSSLGSYTRSAAGGRRSSQGLTIVNSTSPLTKYISPAPADATCIAGFARTHNNPNASDLFAIGDATVTHVTISVASDGTITARRGTNAGTVLGSSAAGAWNVALGYLYFEAKITVDNSAGVVVVKVDGTTVLNLSSQDTQNAGTTAWVWFQCGGASGVSTVIIDDLYVCDGSGSENNDFLGDQRIDSQMPNANGNTSNSTPSTGTDRFATVDEANANGDTDYNTITAVNDKDTLGLANLINAGATPNFVDVSWYAKKTDAGVGKMCPVIRTGGTDYDGTGIGQNTAYQYTTQVYNRDPTSTVWTETTFNAMEVGYKRTA